MIRFTKLSVINDPYHGIIDDDAGEPADVSDNLVNVFDEDFAQEVLERKTAGLLLQPTIVPFLPQL